VEYKAKAKKWKKETYNLGTESKNKKRRMMYPSDTKIRNEKRKEKKRKKRCKALIHNIINRIHKIAPKRTGVSNNITSHGSIF
jgi:hypothetical protein